MDANWIILIVAAVALVTAGYAVYKLGRIPTVTELVSSVEGGIPVGQDFAQVAEIAVNAAEQLKRQGKIATNDEAFNHALNIAKKYLPALTPIENEKMIAAINAAVLVASALTAQIEAAKTSITTTP